MKANTVALVALAAAAAARSSRGSTRPSAATATEDGVHFSPLNHQLYFVYSQPGTTSRSTEPHPRPPRRPAAALDGPVAPAPTRPKRRPRDPAARGPRAGSATAPFRERARASTGGPALANRSLQLAGLALEAGRDYGTSTRASPRRGRAAARAAARSPSRRGWRAARRAATARRPLARRGRRAARRARRGLDACVRLDARQRHAVLRVPERTAPLDCGSATPRRRLPDLRRRAALSLVAGETGGDDLAVDLDFVYLEPGAWGRHGGLPVHRDAAGLLPPRETPALRYGGTFTDTQFDGWCVAPRRPTPPMLPRARRAWEPSRAAARAAAATATADGEGDEAHALVARLGAAEARAMRGAGNLTCVVALPEWRDARAARRVRRVRVGRPRDERGRRAPRGRAAGVQVPGARARDGAGRERTVRLGVTRERHRQQAVRLRGAGAAMEARAAALASAARCATSRVARARAFAPGAPDGVISRALMLGRFSRATGRPGLTYHDEKCAARPATRAACSTRSRSSRHGPAAARRVRARAARPTWPDAARRPELVATVANLSNIIADGPPSARASSS